MPNENNLLIISDIALDLATYNTRIALPIRIKQGDTGTRYIRATITKNSEPLTIAQTANVYINFNRSDSAVRIYSGEVQEDGKLLFLIPAWVTELSRDLSCDITILEEVDANGYRKITTPTFSISVSKVCVPPDAVQADETGDLMLSVLQDLQEMAANEQRRNEDVASAVERADDAAQRAVDAAVNCEEAVEGMKNIAISADDLGLHQGENGIVYPTYRGEISSNGIELSSSDVEVVQTTGESTTAVISQKAVTDIANQKVDKTSIGAANGVAQLDSNGKVPSSQLPSYVDDALEYASKSAFPATGESGKIYVAKDTNLTYRWSGSAYTEISPSLALGETESTAYSGAKGKKNAEDIAANKTNIAANTSNIAALTTRVTTLENAGGTVAIPTATVDSISQEVFGV